MPGRFSIGSKKGHRQRVVILLDGRGVVLHAKLGGQVEQFRLIADLLAKFGSSGQ